MSYDRRRRRRRLRHSILAETARIAALSSRRRVYISHDASLARISTIPAPPVAAAAAPAAGCMHLLHVTDHKAAFFRDEHWNQTCPSVHFV